MHTYRQSNMTVIGVISVVGGIILFLTIPYGPAFLTCFMIPLVLLFFVGGIFMIIYHPVVTITSEEITIKSSLKFLDKSYKWIDISKVQITSPNTKQSSLKFYSHTNSLLGTLIFYDQYINKSEMKYIIENEIGKPIEYVN